MKQYIYDIEKALFYNDYDRAVKLLESEQFTPDLLIDTGDFKEFNLEMPIYFITQLWNEMLPGDWGISQEAVDKKKPNLQKISNYFETVHHIDMSQEIDMMKYRGAIPDVNTDDEQESIFDLFEPKESWFAKGFREIDIDLYNRAIRFDFDAVEKLLIQGANDSVAIEEPDDTVYKFMRDDLSARDWWQSKTLFPHPDYDQRKFFIMDVQCMLESAAKYRMVKLLDKYYKPDSQ